jgi:hypothetical protein
MIIFVGDKPSPKMKFGAKPFEGAACENRLHGWIQFVLKPKDKSVATITCMLINQYDHSFGKLSAWYYRDKHIFIALGNNASRALSYIPHFKLPHPSGKNRQINDKAFIYNKLQECRAWLSLK